MFIVGSGRSGTTLLYELVCSHPASSWVSNYSQRVSAFARVHPSVPAAHKDAAARRALSRLAVRPVEGYRLFDRVRPDSERGPTGDGGLRASDITPREVASLRRAVAQHQAPGRVDFFVNKNTRNTRRVGYLAAAFPDARFVHITRHPLATARSLARVDFFRSLPIFWESKGTVAERLASGVEPEVLAAEFWNRETSLCREALLALENERVLEIHYEDLVTEPRQVLESVFNHVGETTPHSTQAVLEGRGVSNRNTAALHESGSETATAVWRVVGDVAAAYGYRYSP
ncbi:MAG: sulfotransferase [Microthrixaceae bacterium]|nr:sulfotransferase [Microthrixaceae bacterium]